MQPVSSGGIFLFKVVREEVAPKRCFCWSCRSEEDGFPGIDYNDVYRIKDTLAQDELTEDLPEAEMASLGSISIADAEVEMSDFDAASEDSVF